MADPDPLAFGVDLVATRDRLRDLNAFLSVGDLTDAVEAMEGRRPFSPPAAFVSVANEQAEPNRIAAGGHAQRVTVRVSVLFCIKAQRAADNARDEIERHRKAVMVCLTNWTAPGAEKPYGYDRFLIRRTGDGLVWAEVLFLSGYRFSQ